MDRATEKEAGQDQARHGERPGERKPKFVITYNLLKMGPTSFELEIRRHKVT